MGGEVDDRAPVVISATPPTVTQKPVKVGGRVTDIDQAMRISELLAASTHVNVADRGKPANIFLKIMWGAELGLGPAQSLSVISVVNGRPTLEGQLLLALARGAGHKVSFPREDAEGVTCRIVRKDDPEPHEATFTMADARIANLAGKDNWKSYSKDMMQWRAVARAVKKACPEVALGFHVEGEIEPEEEPTPAPTVEVVTVTQEDIQSQVAEIQAEYKPYDGALEFDEAEVSYSGDTDE